MSYREDFEKAQSVLEDLLRQREEIEVRIAKQKRRVAALAELCDNVSEDQIAQLDLGGLTEACKTILRGSQKLWLTVAEIVTGLQEIGFPVNDYKSPMASVNTTIKRLVDGGEVAQYHSDTGDVVYMWIGPWSFPPEHPMTQARKADLCIPATAMAIRNSGVWVTTKYPAQNPGVLRRALERAKKEEEK